MNPVPAADRREFRRSPYLLVEWQGDEMILFDCNTARRVPADVRLVELLTRLGAWRALDAIPMADVSTDEVTKLVDLGMVEERVVPLSPPDAAAGQSTETWTPYELAVQRMTNTGGARELGQASHPPTLRHGNAQGERTPLPAPLPLSPTPIAEVLERRRSRRRYGDRPLRAEELSTVLHHAARITRAGHDDRVGDYALRPYASAGGRSELEIYVLATAIDDVVPGAHFYDAFAHDLRCVRQRDSHFERIVRSVHRAAGGQLDRDPAAILLVTAVFPRVMWKYRNLGLSLIYKDTGCLMQMLYVVATAMELAPCAIGGGEELLNSRWLGLDPLVESQVGCFLLGPCTGAGC